MLLSFLLSLESSLQVGYVLLSLALFFGFNLCKLIEFWIWVLLQLNS